MRILLNIVLILFSSIPVKGQIGRNYFINVNNAFEANTEDQYRFYLKFCTAILKEIPAHPRINYLSARLSEQLGSRNAALRYLKKAAKLGYTANLRWFKIHSLNDPVFGSIRKTAEFREIAEIMKEVDRPVSSAETAFIITLPDFSTEGITYDPAEKMFFLGGNEKIIKADNAGNCVDFTKNGKSDGLGEVNGIHADPVRRVLWVCSNDAGRTSPGIFKYRLSSGRLMKKYIMPPDGEKHMFNDCVIHPDGDVYVTDSNARAVYRIKETDDKPELFFQDESFVGPNGITLSEDGKTIFAGGQLGIYRIDIKTKSFSRLPEGQLFSTYGIDGLYYYRGTLYAVQNMIHSQVCRYLLNGNGSRLIGCEIIERKMPEMTAPTTGVFAENGFYFIANARGKSGGVVIMKAPVE